jgi:uncharacterized protein (DUF2236 family)
MDSTYTFGDSSMIRRVHRERAVGLAGPRALLMMAAHPVAFEGFFMSTGALGDPYERLRRTSVVMNTITFGTKRAADRMTAHVRAAHASATGTLSEEAGRFPAGTPYAASDPELQLWILGCLVDSCLLAYDRYVEGVTTREREAYWQDYRVVGGFFGLGDGELPGTYDDFAAYMHDMLRSDRIHVTSRARELGIDIVMRPPVPLKARPVVELVNQVTIGLLPGRVRREFRLSWDPARALAVRGGAEYVKRVVVPLLPERYRLVPSAQRPAAA